MVIFHSSVSLPEGIFWSLFSLVVIQDGLSHIVAYSKDDSPGWVANAWISTTNLKYTVEQPAKRSYAIHPESNKETWIPPMASHRFNIVFHMKMATCFFRRLIHHHEIIGCIPATNVAAASLPTETGRSPIGRPSRTRWSQRSLRWRWVEAGLLVPEGGCRPWL